MKKIIIVLIAFFIGVFIIYFGLQNKVIYKSTLGLVSQNWESNDSTKNLVSKPYEKLNNDKYIRWDAVHYKLIKDYGYNIEKAGGDYIFAFFPLFPYIWKILNLPALGVVFLNYLFFAIGIYILINLFSNKKSFLINLFLSLSLPSLIIFFIPYSEATFFLMVSIGIYGFMKNKYGFLFLGFFMASLTRPAYTILFLSIIGAEFFFFFEYKKIVFMLKKIFLLTIPLIVGTALVSGIQFFYGSGSIFKFVKVQRYWENILSMPHNLRDWSHEGFAINIGMIFLIFTPLIIIFFQKFFDQLKSTRTNVDDNKRNDKLYYITILSIIYLIGSTLFILLYRGGSLHCLFRFTLCSPFIYILLFGSFKYIEQVPKNFRFFIISTLSLLSIFILGLADYSTYWNFSDFGIFILIFTLFLWLFQDNSEKLYFKIGLYLNLFLNIVWTTYLFNTYIANGWIFA